MAPVPTEECAAALRTAQPELNEQNAQDLAFLYEGHIGLCLKALTDPAAKVARAAARELCRQAQQQHRSILEVVAVDVLAKDHCNVSLLFLSIRKNAHKGEPPCPQGRPGSPYMLFKTERYQYKGIRRFCQHLQTFPLRESNKKAIIFALLH